jgi:hypothetical protein
MKDCNLVRGLLVTVILLAVCVAVGEAFVIADIRQTQIELQLPTLGVEP